MALDQDIFLAVASQEPEKLILHNTDTKFEKFECDFENISISLDPSGPKWHQYFMCGVKGIMDILDQSQKNQIKGLLVLVHGTVPQSAGLSSSSALVSAAALATAHAFGLSLTKEKLADLCASCERYIGTQGGGMDQAIAFLAKEGCAKLIEFEPLRSTEVKLPQGAVFVVAHSLSKMNKAATADFNCRVVECRLAAQILSKKLGLDWTKIKRLGDLQSKLNLDLDEMIALAKQHLKETTYSKDEIIRALETNAVELESISLTPNTKDIQNFKLFPRAYHVFNEAKRVAEFYKTCQNHGGGESALVTLGSLMRQSHESLRDLYECSHEQLDKIVELSKDFTLGTRLTGAGWGGCTVSLVAPDKVEDFLEHMRENFYKPMGVSDNFDMVLFKTAPQGGACIFIEKEL
ncbi:N-acetylgalactosamine kinase isoform X2 [Anthonomus grandis grandis]|nr:N-acetylgalactosamine kinase isoform X2 [Anthonomus grandis grandis]